MKLIKINFLFLANTTSKFDTKNSTIGAKKSSFTILLKATTTVYGNNYAT